MRSVNPAINRYSLNDGFIHLLEIEHDNLDDPIRICNDNVDCTHQGNTYTAYGFEMPELDEREGDLPSPVLVIDNTDQQILLHLMDLATPPTIKKRVVWMSDPDEIVIGGPRIGQDDHEGWVTYKARKFSYNVNHVICHLTLAILANDQFPFHRVTPENNPGGFGRFG